MFEVEIADRQSRLQIDQQLIRRLAENVLRAEGISSASLSVAVVDDPTIHQLNREYLEHDYATDVLSFVLERDDSHLEGEVIVSADTAIAQAPSYQTAPLTEFMLYVLHGVLHLVGYEDGNDEQRQVMREQEQRHLRPLLTAIEEAAASHGFGSNSVSPTSGFNQGED